MTEKSYQDAVQVLRQHLGNRREGIEVEGRDEMVKILQSELGFDRGAANDAIDAMIQSGQLRYHRALSPNAPVDEEVPIPTAVPLAAAGLGTAGQTGQPAAPLAAAAAFGLGYWQIGDEDEPAGPGRAGQVTPRGE